MKTEIMKIKVLYPSENHFLYNAEAKTISDSDKVFLGKDASEGDWQEITLNEKERLEEEWKKEAEEMSNNAT